MKRILRIGAPWIIAAVAVATLLLTRGDRAFELGKTAGAGASDLSGRVSALRTWQDDHDRQTQPIIVRFQKWERYQIAFHQWMRMVSARQGWPPPPDPNEISMRQNNGACGEEPASLYAATP